MLAHVTRSVAALSVLLASRPVTAGLSVANTSQITGPFKDEIMERRITQSIRSVPSLILVAIFKRNAVLEPFIRDHIVNLGNHDVF